MLRTILAGAAGSIAALAFQTPQGVAPETAPPDRRGENPLDFMEVDWSYNDSLGEWIPTIRITGANVQIVNGIDPEGSSSDTQNGLGNLILGYNEKPSTPPPMHSRLGSHNLVIGPGHSYMGSRGIVHGRQNQLLADDSATIGGHSNTVSGNGGVAVAGSSNFIGIDYAWLPDFAVNATVVGGRENTMSGEQGAIIGGEGNYVADGGYGSTITGGRDNFIMREVDQASISGGRDRSIVCTSGGPCSFDWAAGSLYEDD